MARPRKTKAPKESTAPLGHNDLTDEQKTALLLQHIGQIEREQKEQARITANIRNIRKKAKADGFSPEEVNYALFLRKTDPDTAVAAFGMQARIAKWLAHPVGFQADLLGDGIDRTPSVEKAFSEGRVAGMAGDTCTVPEKYGPGSEQGQRWMAGWHEGQAVLSKGFQPLGEPKGIGDDADAAGTYTVN